MFERTYPFAWLGILAAMPPSLDELIYAHHERGFALHSMRTPAITRLYVQCAPDDALDAWPDDRVWEELRARLETRDGWTLEAGPVLEKSITTMRSFVIEPMQYGRLFLAGDAAHVVPPTGAKGLNLAIADVRVLGAALVDWYRTGGRALLDAYSRTCLRRVWRVEHFSWWMTSMLHRAPDDDAFHHQLQLAQLRYVVRLARGGDEPGRELRGVRACLTTTTTPTRASRPGCAFVARCSATSTSIARRRRRRRSTRRSSSSSPRSPGGRSGRAMALDPRTRSLITIALLAAFGRQEELELHLRATRNTGATPEEIREALMHVAVYAGIPAANSAFAARANDRRVRGRRPPTSGTGHHAVITTIGEIVRGDAAVFPPYLYEAYRSTIRRAPHAPLVEVPLTLSELTGPRHAISPVTPDDADLTRNAGTGGEAIGQRIIVTGRVLDDDGAPVVGALLEVWQANAAGRYIHQRDDWPGPLDPNFLGIGRCLTTDDGRVPLPHRACRARIRGGITRTRGGRRTSTSRCSRESWRRGS